MINRAMLMERMDNITRNDGQRRVLMDIIDYHPSYPTYTNAFITHKLQGIIHITN